MEPIAENIERIRERIQAAVRRSGRQPEAIRLVAVTKTVDAERIRAAIALGVSEIGENYVQEAAGKLPILADLSITRHFIGHLQRNKARRAVEWFDVVQSIDSLPLAESLSRQAVALEREREVLVEVNVAGEATKSGVAPEEALAQIHGIGPEIARSVRAFFSEEKNRALIGTLRDVGVVTTEQRAAPAPQTLAGKTLVVTGTLPTLSREAARELVQKHGGRLTSSVSKKTDYVVVGEVPGSKADDARRLGVKIIDEAELFALVAG